MQNKEAKIFDLQKSFFVVGSTVTVFSFECRAINLTLATPICVWLSLRRLSRDPEFMQFSRHIHIIRINFNLCLTLTRGQGTGARVLNFILFCFVSFQPAFHLLLHLLLLFWPMAADHWPTPDRHLCHRRGHESVKMCNCCVDWLDGRVLRPRITGVGADVLAFGACFSMPIA